MIEQHILDYFPEELERVFVDELKAPAFRARQVLEQVYKKRVFQADKMTGLPKDLRFAAGKLLKFDLPAVKTRRLSSDGTVKYLFALSDGITVESVLIPEGRRRTVCFSTQAGCPANCSFCATGQGGFRRNLAPSEIVGQILAIGADQNTVPTNCVAMGQGEPLLNQDNVFRALRILNDGRCLSLSSRHLTLSTVGILPGIRDVADKRLPCRLAISLHSADEEVRERLIPISKKHPLADLKKTLRYYADVTKNRITFEYLLLAGVNDRKRDARALIRFASGLPSFINLIPWNPVPGLDFREPAPQDVRAFAGELESAGFSAAIRKEKGRDIGAACGQLTQQGFHG